MFAHYLQLALRSLRRTPVLTALMVMAIALGIGASMTTLTVFHVLSGDPIPGKSERLFYPRMDPRSLTGFTPGDGPEEQMTRLDAEALLREKRGVRQALMTAGSAAVEPQRSGIDPLNAEARFTSADFFPMFDVPFAHGRGWSAAEDEARAQVVVLSKPLNDRLFGGADSTGRTLRMEGETFRVIGVLDAWRPTPRFYDMTMDRYGDVEQLYMPFSTSRALRFATAGNMNCWGDDDSDDPDGNLRVGAPCAWVQYWVQLDTPAQVSAYRDYLRNYSDQQRSTGRFERPTNVRLHSVMEWLDEMRVVPGDVRLQLWLALGFLAVCVLNTVGLLLAKFLRRSGEIGVRRALGASRRAIFAQFLVEAGVIGLAGGIAGLGLAALGLWAVRQQPTSYAALAQMDMTMLAMTFAIAVGASVLAGLLPALRACQVVPAMQLKSQ